ncbi:hypothetical protein BV25DRAFT_1922257 [Artomyces pyxidatus]|uniref:Uncharacterized protein n=1 Tax=Artomyces pyxidatus TaxID=48021 RepID=A0ACB8SFD4_9AGAM|nr:hypothetical protein BV25DRAFT_1922257 [Artomyces pyxidatus]
MVRKRKAGEKHKGYAMIANSPAPNTVPIRHTHIRVRAAKISQKVSHHIVSSESPPPGSSDSAELAGGEGQAGTDGFVDEGHEEVYIGQEYEGDGHRRKRHRSGRKSRKKRRVELLREWLPLRDTFMDELLRHEGLGRHLSIPQCTGCGDAVACVRCEDCFGSPLVCESCICADHAKEPLHRIQKWNGAFFEKYSLSEAGLCIQLGHDGLVCPLPRPYTTTMTVIDISGVHRVCVRFCDCSNAGTAYNYVQLLRARWWPATVQRPRTVITLRSCKLFHALALQGKVNAYDFWNGLCRITDGTGLRPAKNHYKDFIRAMRCFRSLRMAKRAGRAHDPLGINATESGELVVECPACPQPGRNLPDGWEDAPSDEQWKYAIMLAIDANFKLKLKNRGLDDVQLAPGWAYFVDEKPYQEHIAQYKDQVEMKHCGSNFAARDHANVPAQKRFCVNGVGAVICARHCFYRKSGVGDLQRGERYCNMDFVLLSTIAKTAEHLKTMVLSYDIACQYSKNFLKRMADFPTAFHIDVTDTSLTFVVPKFHLLAHGVSCQVSYSLNFTEGVGRTCGEGIEAGWSETNGAALSTREMSSESRHEILNDFFGAINWRKVISMGDQLQKSLKEAVPAYAKQKRGFDESTASFPPEVIEKWERMISTWERDRSKPNPYAEPEIHHTLADVRLELAQQEAEEVKRGVVSLHETSASVFLSTGLDLEDQQRALVAKCKHEDSKTSSGKATIQEKRNALQHRLKGWRILQQIYMPATVALLAQEAAAFDSADDTSTTSPPVRVEYEKLWLPSEVPRELWRVGFAPGLVDKAVRLRIAQAEEALHNLRRQLRIRKGLIHYKHVFVDGPGQNANTRARATIKKLSDRMAMHVKQYRAARNALVVLSPEGSWQSHLRELRDEDIRAPREDEEGLGEGHRETPWIWRVLAHTASDVPGGDEELSQEEVHDGLRVDWVKNRARARRWYEEIIHLCEEMPRVIKFLQWKAEWWLGRAALRPDAALDIQSGLKMYAERQAAMFTGLARKFKIQWSRAITGHALTVILPPLPPPPSPPPPSSPSPSPSASVPPVHSPSVSPVAPAGGASFLDVTSEWSTSAPSTPPSVLNLADSTLELHESDSDSEGSEGLDDQSDGYATDLSD